MNASRLASLFSRLDRLRTGAIRFVSAPASPKPLAALRIGISGILLFQALAIAGALVELFGSRGIMQWMNEPLTVGLPRMRWFVDLAARVNLDETFCLRAVFLTYVGSLGCLLVGWHTRTAAVIAWFLQMTFRHTAATTMYGADSFAHIILFYLMWMPVGHAWSMDQSSGRVSGEPSPWARLSIRTIQLHLCLVYLISGVEKAAGWDWWNGEAIWCSLMRRDLCAYDMSWLAEYPFIAVLLCLGTLVVEIGYAAFVWPSRTRVLWAISTLGLHVGIGIFMGLAVFSATMMAMTASMFLFSADPQPATQTVFNLESVKNWVLGRNRSTASLETV